MKQKFFDISTWIFWYLIGDDFSQHLWEFNTHVLIQKCLEAKVKEIFNHLQEKKNIQTIILKNLLVGTSCAFFGR